jgi:hypothetical protein
MIIDQRKMQKHYQSATTRDERKSERMEIRERRVQKKLFLKLVEHSC